MKYSKLSLSFEEQLSSLKQKGLRIDDEALALKKLSSLSYYRLRAYTYPFQDNTDKTHPFTQEISFEEIIQLYEFDKDLRHLVFQKLERIEITWRTQIVYHYSQAYGSHWQMDKDLYFDQEAYDRMSISIASEVNRSNEDFIKHYKKTYSVPQQPPSWMALEVVSMGSLSMLYSNLKNNSTKKEIAKGLGFVNIYQLQNWMYCFSQMRNICAHHGRLWNRRLSKIQLPYNLPHTFLSKADIKKIYPNKIYAFLCAINYLLNRIESGNSFSIELKALMETLPLNQSHEMGFPDEWGECLLWK